MRWSSKVRFWLEGNITRTAMKNKAGVQRASLSKILHRCSEQEMIVPAGVARSVFTSAMLVRNCCAGASLRMCWGSPSMRDALRLVSFQRDADRRLLRVPSRGLLGLPRFAPVTITALLATLVLIFALQADNTSDSSTSS